MKPPSKTQNRTVDSIITDAETIEDLLSKIRKKQKCVLMFIDLVGSTEFKQKHPDELIWLKRIAVFMRGVSNIINQYGRVVKYIGDEVMAVFEKDDYALHAIHVVEEVLSFCKNAAGYDFQVKIALDYGTVSMIDYLGPTSKENRQSILQIPADPQGSTVDRCARIMSKTQKNIVLCSFDFYSISMDKARWRSCGKFNAKGLVKPVKVYQFKNSIVDAEQLKMIRDDFDVDLLRSRIKDLENMLEDLKNITRK